MYQKVTKDISVVVNPLFLEEQSRPEECHYVWSYTIKIENLGKDIVQLLSRHWLITDLNGHTQEVRGEGVVGEQPTLKPGESFSYTSGAPLSTATGFMGGSYQMQAIDGSMFNIDIPTFSLDIPEQRQSLH